MHKVIAIAAASLLLGVAGVSGHPQPGHPQPRPQQLSDDANDWPQDNHDNLGSRFNPAERRLSRDNVARLAIDWQFQAGGPVHATPAVVGERIYAGDESGLFHALNDRGTELWSTQLGSSIYAGALITDRMAFVATLNATLYALNLADGSIAWQARPNPHPIATMYGAPLLVANQIIVPISSDEGFAAADPSYPCCSASGSLAAFDPDTGALRWQKFTITDADRARGAAGAGVWGTPSYDAESGLIYIGTGQNYVEPATDTSDSIFALDARTGETVWQTQVTSGDVWNLRLPPTGTHRDGDFGDSPKVYRLPSGRKVLSVGQKTGTFWVFDARTGAPIASQDLLPRGVLGGFQMGGAQANGINFAHGVDWPDLFVDPNNPNTAPRGGTLLALSGRGRELWRFDTTGSPFIAGIAVAAGVVYGVSSGTGTLYALDTEDGTALASIELGPGAGSPSVAHGHVYVGTGNTLLFALPTSTTGTITSLAVPRHRPH